MTTTTFPTISVNRAPSAARAPGLGAQIWNTLVRLGALRAAAQMRQLAHQYDVSRPELAQQLREAARRGLNG